jgi:alpha-2-macroglobulin
VNPWISLNIRFEQLRRRNEGKMKTRWLLPILACIFSLQSVNAQESTAGIVSFNPEGLAKNVRQVRVRFSEAMTPMGDPRDQLQPFLTECPVKGSSKWEDSRNWIYDFEKDLPGGTSAVFKLRPGLKTLGGKPVVAQSEFKFNTGGPSIKNSRPWDGSPQIDEEQIFLLQLDGPADEASVLKSVFFEVEGIGEKIGVRIIKGKARTDLLKAMRSIKETPDTPLLLLQANRRFSNNAKIQLIWSKDVLSPTGLRNEADQILSFSVRPVFRAKVECQRVNAGAPCIPITPVEIVFTSPAPWSKVRQVTLEEPGGKKYSPVRREYEAEQEYIHSATFNGPFPEKAALKMVLPSQFKDDAGRPLSNESQFPLTLRMDEYPPLVKFAADFGILELNADPILPVTVRNVEPKLAGALVEVKEGNKTVSPEEVADPERTRNILNVERANRANALQGKILQITPDRANQVRFWFKKITDHENLSRDRRAESLLEGEAGKFTQTISIPKVTGPKSFEVVGIPLKKPGFYIVEIKSEILGAALLEDKRPMYVASAALVTNLSVHFKWGVQSSIVWVTTLDQAKLVNGAHVEIRDCNGRVLWRGETDKDGIARPIGVPSQADLRDCMYSRYGSGLMVTAQVGDDFSFVFSGWDDGIEPWRFKLPVNFQSGERLISAQTVLDRPLFRAGETVHMKHFLRRQLLEGFGLLASSERPARLQIMHLGSDKKFDVPLRWLPDGSAESDWIIPQQANLGTYQLMLEFPKKNDRTQSISTGTFRVEEFRLPILKAGILPPAQTLVAPTRVSFGLQVSYMSGGGASDLKVKFRHKVQNSFSPAPEAFEGFLFSNGIVKEGVKHSSQEYEDEEGTQEEEAAESAEAMKSRDLVLDKTGNAQVQIQKLPEIDQPKEILAELEYPDPNGEIQTVSRHIPLYPSRWQIGIQPDSWAGSREKLKFKVAVADIQGKPVRGASVQVELLSQKYYSHRSRLIGGFYEYDSVTEIKKIGNFCSGTTNERGLLFCEAASPVEGNVILQARTKDPEGRANAVHQSVWVAGKENWWFNVSKDDRIDVLPEKKRYEPGETARLQVRMPFQEAIALVTIEREGVSDVYIQKLTGQSPLIDVPMKPNYAPNIFVSVLVIRGRTGEPQATAMVDLGRPAYKLGIAEIKVGWKGHELKVQVNTQKSVYQVRQKVPVEIHVRQADNGQPASGGEVAVAAVDESLLELLPNDSWNLLDSMMGQRPYSVHSSTSQMHVIGKRHFGLKSLPGGGGGGREPSRELFDTLLLWKGRVPLDSQGTAKIEIPLNDSLSSFRIVAVASSGSGRFGTGSSTIRSTQDLMVLSGVPPVIRQSDRFSATFTVRNNTASAMSLDAQLQVSGLSTNFTSQELSLNPNEAKVISWEIAVPVDCEQLSYQVQVKASSGQQDKLQIKQKVTPYIPVKPWQATIFQLERKQRTEVARPADALTARGGIQVQLRPKISDGLPGVVDYMKNYPYSCLEQETSRAVALQEKGRWDFIMERLPAYLDGNGLAKYFASCRWGSVVLTAYVLSIGNEAGWTIPSSSKDRLIAGLRGFLDGRVTDSSISGTRDLELHKLIAMEALSRYGVGVKDWITTITVNPNLWPTSALIDWREILKRQPNLPNHDQRTTELDKILSARLDFRGTVMGFSTEQEDFRWWLMVCGDVNANRLILSVLNSPSWREDMPRLIRGTLFRQNFGRWLTTVANAWGVLALQKFSQLFENEPVQGTSQGELGAQKQNWDWAKTPKGDTRLFQWPEGPSGIELEHLGSGKPWAVITSMAAIPLKEPFSNGYRVNKTVSAVAQKTKGAWSRGDILRVRLECEAQTDMGWVVVSDPIPGGAVILGTGLGRDSQIVRQGEKAEGWVYPAFQERSQEAFRAYYEYVPKGKWIVEYTVRLNNPGQFHLPATRVEALYAPEMLGELPNDIFTVAP